MSSLRDNRFSRESTLLVVDDDEANVRLVVRLLEWTGYQRILTAADGKEAISICGNNEVDLVLLDLHMPGMSGYEVLQTLREAAGPGDYLPILVFTADVTKEARAKALEMGASDFLTKPGDAAEIQLRVRNFLKMRQLQQHLRGANEDLEDKIRERTEELKQTQVEIVERLAAAAEYRDDDTGEHAMRVGETSAEISRFMGMPDEFIELIRLAARLHDIGKIAIPDAILLKPGKLDPAERSDMEIHTTVGGNILRDSKSSLLQMAQRIAETHHERWDGCGYPRKLAGEDIPIEGRIVAVADVFDALTNERPYKRAWPRSEAVGEIMRSRGTQFDPRVVDAFMETVERESRAA